MKRIPEIQIMEEDGTMLDLSDDQRAPHNVREFFVLNQATKRERLDCYASWRHHEPATFGGGAAPLFYLLLVEPQ